MSLDNRYIAPIFITCILVTAHFSFGVLESYQKTALAIVASILAELVLGRVFFGKWPNVASAYITGISVGILVRSPAFWPYVLCSVISITSKYVLRVKGRHIWNPSNFGISAMLFLAPETVATFEHSVGQLSFADDGDLGAGVGDHLALAAVPHHGHLCGIVHRVCVFAQLHHGKSVAIGNRAADRARCISFLFFS